MLGEGGRMGSRRDDWRDDWREEDNISLDAGEQRRSFFTVLTHTLHYAYSPVSLSLSFNFFEEQISILVQGKRGVVT